MPATPIDKNSLRARALAARARLAGAAGEEAGRNLAARGLELMARLPGRVVAGYFPVRGEMDVLPLLEALAAEGREIALPVVKERGAPLVFRRWRPGGELRRDAFGVPVPPPHAPLAVPEVVIVPLVAFDRRGHRLGYGGGFYDRTLAHLRGRGPLVAVGAAHCGQEVAEIPSGEHDQPLDWIVTERETIGPLGAWPQ